MLVALYFVLILLLFYKQKSKVVRILALLYLFVLFAFADGIADKESYTGSLLSGQDLSSLYGMGYNIIAILFNSHNIDIQWLYVGCAFFYLPILFFFILKASHNSNYPIACYMLSVFYLDVVQLRFSLSLIFVYLAFCKLIDFDDKKALFKFVLFILMSAIFHISTLYFLVFVLTRLFDEKKMILISIAIFVVLLISSVAATEWIGESLNLSDKTENILDSSNYAGTHKVATTIIMTIMISGMYLLMSRNMLLHGSVTDSRLFKWGKNCALLLLTIIPLYYISADFRRESYVIYVVLVSVLCGICKTHRKILWSVPILVGLILLYYSVLAGNMDTVFSPLFRENLLLKNL